MDNFGNYPREKFDPFSVMLFKGLQVVAFLFFIALLAMNPEAKEGKIESKAEFIITMTWPDDHPDDIDLYVEDPLGNIVWYHVREGGFMVLDRDDRGGANNTITVDGRKITTPFARETISIRAIVAGEYTVNVHYFLATKGGPVPVSSRSRRSTPPSRVVSYENISLARMGRRRLPSVPPGRRRRVVDVNHRPKSLIQLTRNVRRSDK